MVKTFKNLLLQNQISPGPYLCTNPWGQKIYQNCQNEGPTLTFDLFMARSKFAFACICMGPIHLYGENVENSYFGHLLYNPVESKLDDEH